jgi:hypothetical protein
MFQSNLAHERVTVRPAHVGDEPALARLAALDSAEAPTGPALVAEADARILAALPLGSGRPIADPFVPTAELVALLRLRAEQLGRDTGRRGFRGLFGTRPALG